MIYGILRVSIKLKTSLTDHSMLGGILQSYEVWTWTLVSHSTKIVGNRDTLPSHTKLKVQSVSKIINYIKANIINTLYDVARQTSRLTCPDLKWNKKIYVLTHSNTLILKGITKQIPTSAFSGSIVLTENGMIRNIKKSGTIEPSQFTQL